LIAFVLASSQPAMVADWLQPMVQRHATSKETHAAAEAYLLSSATFPGKQHPAETLDFDKVAEVVREELMLAMLNTLQDAATACADICVQKLRGMHSEISMLPVGGISVPPVAALPHNRPDSCDVDQLCARIRAHDLEQERAEVDRRAQDIERQTQMLIEQYNGLLPSLTPETSVGELSQDYSREQASNTAKLKSCQAFSMCVDSDDEERSSSSSQYCDATVRDDHGYGDWNVAGKRHSADHPVGNNHSEGRSSPRLGAATSIIEPYVDRYARRHDNLLHGTIPCLSV